MNRKLHLDKKIFLELVEKAVLVNNTIIGWYNHGCKHHHKWANTMWLLTPGGLVSVAYSVQKLFVAIPSLWPYPEWLK